MKTIQIMVNANNTDITEWKLLWQTINAHLGLGQTVEVRYVQDDEDLLKRIIVEVETNHKNDLDAVNSLLATFQIDADVASEEMYTH